MSSFDDDLANAEKLLKSLGAKHPRYLDAHTLFERLKENISKEKLYGESPTRSEDRARIRYGLNEICLEVFGLTTDGLDENAIAPAPVEHFTRKNGEAQPAPVFLGSRSTKLIFISHSSKDNEFVARLATDLSQAGFRVWHDDQDIKVIDSIPAKISQGLIDCNFFLLVLTPDSVASHWVKQETDAAFAAQKPIVAVLLKDCSIPVLIQAHKYADFRTQYKTGLHALLDGLDAGQISELSFIFESIDLACSKGDIIPEQEKSLKAFIIDIALKKRRGENPMPPADRKNTGEMFLYTSEALVYDLLSLSEYHAEWSDLVVSDNFKRESVKLLVKMHDKILVSSALVREITALDYQNEIERILTPLNSLRDQLKNIDDHLLSGKVPFHVSNEIERNFDDLTYHLNRYLSVLDGLATTQGYRRRLQ